MDYVVIDYGGANGFGATIRSQGLFMNGEYICDLDDFSSELSHEKTKALINFRYAVGQYSVSGAECEPTYVDVSKIKKKMGID